jgi:hypothetical protein
MKYFLWKIKYVRPKARHVIQLQVYIIAYAIEIRALQSPKCKVWCAVDCTASFKRRFVSVCFIHTHALPERISVIDLCPILRVMSLFLVGPWLFYCLDCEAFSSVSIILKMSVCNNMSQEWEKSLRMSSYTYLPLTLNPRRGSRDISDIPPRPTHFIIMT